MPILEWMNGGTIDAHTVSNVKIALYSLPAIGAVSYALAWIIDRPHTEERN